MMDLASVLKRSLTRKRIHINSGLKILLVLQQINKWNKFIKNFPFICSRHNNFLRQTFSIFRNNESNLSFSTKTTEEIAGLFLNTKTNGHLRDSIISFLGCHQFPKKSKIKIVDYNGYGVINVRSLYGRGGYRTIFAWPQLSSCCHRFGECVFFSRPSSHESLNVLSTDNNS